MCETTRGHRREAMSSEGSYYVEMEAEAQYETEWATMKQRIEYDMPDMNIDRDYVQQYGQSARN